MRKLAYILTLALIVNFSASSIAQEAIRLATYNIRYNNAKDGINAWPNRKDKVLALIRFHELDIVCVQEALADQYDEIEKGTGFAAFGAGRDDGLRKGEFAPIFYNKNRFEQRAAGVFWLSETPDKPSKGWDAALNRVCTWLHLYDKANKKVFMVFNTNYDHVGVQARIEAAKLIKTKINELAKGVPIVFAGDLNVKPDSEAISTIKTFLFDTKERSEQLPYGPDGTFNAFNFNSPLQDRIDYVFINDFFRVQKYAVLSDNSDLRYYSDHLPVMVKLFF